MNTPAAFTEYAKTYGSDYRAHRITNEYYQIAPDGDEPIGMPIVVTMYEGKVIELDTDAALAVLALYVED